jgi:endoglucanase
MCVQDVRSQNDTRVPIHNNVGFIGSVASMHDAPGTWEQCLQGYGVLNKANSIC